MRTNATIAVLFIGLALARSAHAEEERAARESPTTLPTWLYLEPAQVAAPLRTFTFSRVTFAGGSGTSSTGDATRPFASDVAHTGAILEAGGEVGIAEGVALSAFGRNDALGGAPRPSSGMSAGLRFKPFRASRGAPRVVASAGVLNELSGHYGAWSRLALEQDFGPTRLAFLAHGEHVLAPGRDALDVMVMAGASTRVAGPLRAGIEYVAQDLEGALDPEEVEGTRHFLGPTLGLELMPQRVSLAMGLAAGLSSRSPSGVGRAAIAVSF